jgi:hypothetical protein
MSGKSPLQARPVLSRQEGRIAIVTNAGGDAVDAAASARRESQGEFLVSDLPVRGTNGAFPGEPFGEDGWLRTAKACGPDASVVGVKSRGGVASPTGRTKPYSRDDGGRKARYSGESAP